MNEEYFIFTEVDDIKEGYGHDYEGTASSIEEARKIALKVSDMFSPRHVHSIISYPIISIAFDKILYVVEEYKNDPADSWWKVVIAKEERTS